MLDSYDSFYRGRKVLITGGLGFIGSNLAHRLLDCGAQVSILDALIPNFGGNMANVASISARLRISHADQRDQQAVAALLPGQEIIFNLAGQVSHLDSMTDPLTDLDSNVRSHVVLLEACRALNPEARIVFASTRQIYGRPRYLPVDEAHPLVPVDVNGINKMSAEAFHALYHTVYGMPTVSLRLTNTYGPRMRIKDARQTFLGIWLRRAVEGGKIDVWGGSQQRDLTYVEDVADAFLAAGMAPASALGQAFNVGGGPPISLRELAEQLIELAGSGEAQFKEFPVERKRIDIGDYFADDRAFRELTGWQPITDLRSGLTRSIDYYRRNLHAYI